MTSSNASAVNGPTQDGSSVAAPPVASPLPAPEPASVPEFSESVDPVTPTGLADVGWPTAPAPTTAVGVGPLTALAFVLIIGKAERFQCGKQIASYLGLVPLEKSSGNRSRL